MAKLKTSVRVNHPVRIKEIGEGDDGKMGVKAVFATLGVVDKHGDVILPGAIGKQDVILSAYGHNSWGNMFGGVAEAPIGKGKTYEEDNEAIFDGELFSTSASKDMYVILKELGENQEWSFSLHNVEYRIVENYEDSGKTVYELESIDVHEVSPVLMGAGINTRTLQVKSLHDLRSLYTDDDDKDYEKLYHDLKKKYDALNNKELRSIAHGFYSRQATGG